MLVFLTDLAEACGRRVSEFKSMPMDRHSGGRHMDVLARVRFCSPCLMLKKFIRSQRKYPWIDIPRHMPAPWQAFRSSDLGVAQNSRARVTQVCCDSFVNLNLPRMRSLRRLVSRRKLVVHPAFSKPLLPDEDNPKTKDGVSKSSPAARGLACSFEPLWLLR